jgi:hypothetical protein
VNFDLLIPLVISTLVAILGWIVGHKLNNALDRASKHRDLRLQYLVSAYRKLESSIGRNLVTDTEAAKAQEEACADIQLFGTQPQIDRLLAALKQGEGADLDPVLNLLRDELRSELCLPKITGNVLALRYRRGTSFTRIP